MAMTPLTGARMSRARGRLTITGRDYLLQIAAAADGFANSPYALLCAPDGEPWAALNLLSSVDTARAADETWELGPLEAEVQGENVILSLAARSTAWTRRTLRMTCTPGTVEVTVTVAGAGRITELNVFGGRATLPSGAGGLFRSGIGFRSVFVPAPTEPVQLVRDARSAAALGVVGDADPGRLNSVFSPPPLVLGLGRRPPAGPTQMPAGPWLGLSVRAPVRELGFTTLRYEPLEAGFLLRLDYEGHTSVDGTWTSPAFVFRPAATGWEVIDGYREDLLAHGFSPVPAYRQEAWWREPIFCGWGAQCARLARALGAVPAPAADTGPDGTAPGGADSIGADGAENIAADSIAAETAEEDAVAHYAAGLARQDVYDEFLARLAAHGLRPGTIIIDDRWQADYGSPVPDPAHWPDLRAWIAERHAHGQKVLLWWKAWDPGGVPAAECVLDPGGRPVAVDPANPAYRARLHAAVAHLLSNQGLDADGFKVDFTQRAPSGRSLAAAPGAWGIAGLHLLLGTLYRSAKDAKADALVICHAVHPSFADVCDMVRLNDLLKRDVHGEPVPVVDQLLARHQIVSRTLPGRLIDTDQWPMPSRSAWLDYAALQPHLGVPALYYLESIDRSGEAIGAADLAQIAAEWARYRESLRP